MMAAAAVRSSPMPPSPNTNKRKRGPTDQDNGRDMKMPNTNGPDVTSDYTFLQAIQDNMQGADGSAQTAQAALATPMSHSQYPDSFDTPNQLQGFGDGSGAPNNTADNMGSTAQAYLDARQQHSSQKPSVGSVAWHQQRKDNHKEVERRRREVINEGIENIAKIVPGSEKNKGAILARTCSYIAELNTKINGFDNERRVFEGTLSELTNRHDTLKRECERAWAESQKWQQRCREAGLSFDDYSIGGGNDDQGMTVGGAGSDNAIDTFDGGVDPDTATPV